MNPTSIILLALIVACAIGFAAASTTTVRVFVPAAAFGKDPWASTALLRQAFTARTGIAIEFVPLGAVSTTYVSSAIQTLLATQSSYIDVILMDVVWVGNYGDHLLPLDDDSGIAAALQPHNPQNIAAGVYHNKLRRAVFTNGHAQSLRIHQSSHDVGQMESMISAILPGVRQSKPTFLGISNHINPEEGFTCNILEWLASESAGTVLEPDGTLSSFDLSSPIGQRVLNVAHRWRRWNQNGWLQVGMSQAATANQWVKGNTLFLRHWPYVSSTTRDANVTWPWRMSMLPGNVATLGGWMWGVSKYSTQQVAAKKVLELFAGIEWQKVRAVAEGNAPTITALYNDSDVCAVLPICDLAPRFKVVRRPSSAAGMQYTQVSAAIYNHFFDIVRGYAGSIAATLDGMNRDIARILSIDVLGRPTNVQLHNFSVVAFGIVAIIMALALMASLALFAVTRTTSVVGNLGLPSFLAPSTIGLIMQLTLIITTAGVPNSATCYARYWIHGIGYTLAIMSVAMRNHHIWSTSLNPFLKKRNPSSRVVLTTVVAPLVVTFAILIGFTASGAIDANDIKLSKSRYYECKSLDPNIDSAAHIVWYIWLGVQMLTALWTGLKASKLATAPQEPKATMICLANAAMLAIVILPFIDLGLVDQSTSYILRSILIEVPIATFILVFLAPRLLLAWQHWRHPTSLGAASEQHFAQADMSAGLETMHLSSSTPHYNIPNPNAVSHTAVATPAPTHGVSSPIKPAAASRAVNVHAIAQASRHFVPRLLGFMRPWKLMRLYLLQSEGLLVLHDLSKPLSAIHGVAVPVDLVDRVRPHSQTDNQFVILLKDGLTCEVMVASSDESQRWVAAIAGAVSGK
ncbi:hypothetical protein BCR44DRAFT_1512352 [Catenaria anguillulae PL171]|uniref:G-protein coupled receptors family 3 profile domain-containing protein n=1 Tax=Catenaria anguillulae PL171 TaxID=765915 RepID=A0A1Y2HPL8_9FUNG|nr:hypothetical protein BCR44DRAFT_1512352 [Catenaria anguillulae PL171]